MIRSLPSIEIEGHVPSTEANEDHPMRIVTRTAAGLGTGAWDDDTKTRVNGLFDSLAGEWHTRSSPERTRVVEDALARGDVGDPAGVCLEIGSGIGVYSPLLAARHRAVMSLDLSEEMLRLAPTGPAHRVRADASRLPVADGLAASVVLVNMFLFPEEVDRVLAPGGQVVWVNSSGEQTPIHLPPDEVVAALPGEWEGVQSRAGVGIWCVLRRAAG